MSLTLSAQQTRRLRMKCQLLLSTEKTVGASPERVLEKVIAVQAQDLPAARLSIWARSADLTVTSVEQARQETRSIVWTWCLRGTMHLLASQDAAWLIPFLGPLFISASEKRFQQLGWDELRANAGLNLLQCALQENFSLTRPEIIRLLRENGLPCEGQAPIHLIRRAALEGIICLGAEKQGKPTYVLYTSWLGGLRHLAPQEALAEIALRYLNAFGPATAEDLAAWSGLKVSQAREAWQMISDHLVAVEAAGKPSWILKDHLPFLDDLQETEVSRERTIPPIVRLLPAFDTYLLGYTNRDLTVAAEYSGRIHPGGGLIYPVLLVDGVALGTWQIKPRGKRIEIVIAPFERLDSELLSHIEVQIADLARFLARETVIHPSAPLPA